MIDIANLYFIKTLEFASAAPIAAEPAIAEAAIGESTEAAIESAEAAIAEPPLPEAAIGESAEAAIVESADVAIADADAAIDDDYILPFIVTIESVAHGKGKYMDVYQFIGFFAEPIIPLRFVNVFFLYASTNPKVFSSILLHQLLSIFKVIFFS